jgi:hypothetical protein
MSLKKTTVTDLQRELRTEQAQYVRLQAQCTKCGERIEVLKKILGKDRPRKTPISPARNVTQTRSRSGRGKWVTSTDVINALRQHPGSKAAAITKAMREQGFKTKGRLSHRVYNELWRLAREGRISKTSDGRFTLKEGTAA